MGIERFLQAQEDDYAYALEEVCAGEKTTHWIWYIFPQVKGLGSSRTSIYYGINGLSEAREYLANETLRNRLVEISEAFYALEGKSARDVFGPDAVKVRSCMTLFAKADPSLAIFRKVLDKYYDGKMDPLTLRML